MKGVIIPTASLSDNPILLILKCGKDKGCLMMDYCKLNAVFPSKAFIPNVQYY